MLLHVVEFLFVVSARFNVMFYFEYHHTAVSEVSQGKSEVPILFKLSRFRKWNTLTVQQTLGITKKRIIWVSLQNLRTIVLR